jgi:hypothetical protein
MKLTRLFAPVLLAAVFIGPPLVAGAIAHAEPVMQLPPTPPSPPSPNPMPGPTPSPTPTPPPPAPAPTPTPTPNPTPPHFNR